MKPPFPSLTPTWHNATYPSISPTHPPHTLTSKTIIVTGGGRGLGPHFASAFATAGAARIILIGRTLSSLSETKGNLERDFSGAGLKVEIYSADVADEKGMGEVAGKVGGWDVLVLNAGLIAEPKSVEGSGVGEWWGVFETNVKGAMVTTRAFLPTHNPDASIIGISANMITLPASSHHAQGASAYGCSKFAQARLLEYVAAECEDVFVASVHPGCVETDMLKQSGLELPKEWLDDPNLPSHFLVWLVSKDARFLKGKYLCANWDVDELKAKKEAIETSRILEVQIYGWPYGDVMDAMLAKGAEVGGK